MLIKYTLNDGLTVGAHNPVRRAGSDPIQKSNEQAELLYDART